MPADRITGWLVTLVITAIAFAMRVVNLGYPNKLVFDETYYAKDAYSLLKFGYERNWPSKANAQITAGNVDVMEKTASFIVHPPVGKWLIAAGEHFFGMNSFGWRVAPLVFGTLLILVTIRLVRRVSRSTLIGGLAGLLLTFDGLEFVMSRTALLDIFLAFFVVAAVACLAADRDWFRNRLADHLERHELPDLGGRFGPALWLRPWRIAAGISFGLALGTKWNALYLLAAFALLSLAWDVGARRLAGAGVRANLAVLRDGVPAFVSLVVLSGVVYVAELGGLAGHLRRLRPRLGRQAPGRAQRQAVRPAARLAAALPARHLELPHRRLHQPRRARLPGQPGRLAGGRAADRHRRGERHQAGHRRLRRAGQLHPGDQRHRHPGPVVGGDLRPDRRGDPVGRRPGLALRHPGGRRAGRLAAVVPVPDRPLFFFYAIAMIPFSVMAVALCVGRLLGDARAGDRRMIGAIVAGAFVALVAANFAYLYPILTDELLPYPAWLSRMWFKSWI